MSNETQVTIEDLEARVKELEGVASNYRLAAAKMEHLQRERRYRLLQAAATIQAGLCAHNGDVSMATFVVASAEELLAEVEKQENAEAQS